MVEGMLARAIEISVAEIQGSKGDWTCRSGESNGDGDIELQSQLHRRDSTDLPRYNRFQSCSLQVEEGVQRHCQSRFKTQESDE